MSKLQGTHPLDSPMEMGAVLLVIFGYFLAVSARTSLANYVILFLAGILFGRIAAKEKRKRLPALLLLAAFLAGWLMGLSAGNPALIFISLLAGAVYGFRAQDSGLWPFA